MVDKMESTERRSAYAAAEASSEVSKEPPLDHRAVAVLGLPPDVEAGTQSTDELNPTSGGASPSYRDRDRDGSVISAMTDMISLEGPNVDVPSILGEEETGSQQSLEPHEDYDVPKQVILPEDSEPFPGHNDGSSPPPPSHSSSPTNEEKVVVSTTPGQGKGESEGGTAVTVTTASLPERQRVDADDSVCRSTITESDTVNNAANSSSRNLFANKESSEDDGGMDDYIRSPEVQNAIVERSPGGRYVRFMEKLGSGASKDVYRAYDTQEGIEVAWNVVNLSGVPKTERNRIVNEVRLLERLHHQNIISFHGSWVNRERQEVNFVTEILSSGTLKSFINKVQVIRWKIAKRWALQILKGLEYLHSQDPPVIHRDLKCENIFINGTSGDLRIGDLGLSTVHRNGKVLSVLGTPEFMAPDMYEENSYNEKVDVYAFGMCLLEIFTKEIPYSECSNPAQIYKKVSAGEPPEVLSRLQSKHARDFVMLCLGYRDESGNFIRPTVSELLVHPFLDKRANDDDEVVVDRPLRERTITETSGDSITGTPVVKRKVGVQSGSSHSHQNSLGQPLHGQAELATSGEGTPPSVRKLIPSTITSSQDEEDGDRFEEMQESEINMRKVKVLMGRGQELKEDEDVKEEIVSVERPPLPNSNHNGQAPQRPPPPPPNHNPQESPGRPVQEDHVAAAFHYLVAAAVLENENPNVRPYADDILKLVVTLPVDGQTQNVQFDFHLVEDDPVQVAKEMVKELGIPQGAVLEISETISGLARTARMKQDKYAVRFQNTQNQPQPAFHQGAPPTQQSNVQYHSYGALPSHPPTHQSGIATGLSQQDMSQYQHTFQPTSLPPGSVVAQSEHVLYAHPQPQSQSAGQHQHSSLSNGMANQDALQYQQSLKPPPFPVQQMSYPEPLKNGTHPDQHPYHHGSAAAPRSQQPTGQMTGAAPEVTQYQYEGTQQSGPYQVQQVAPQSRDIQSRQLEPQTFLQPAQIGVIPRGDVPPQGRPMQPTISSSDYVGSQHQNQQYQSQEMQPMHSAAHAGSYGIDAQNPQHQAPSHAPPQSTPPLAAVYPTTAGPVTGQMMPTQHNNPTPTTGHFSVGIPPAPVGTPQGLPVPHIVNPVQSDPATMKDQTIPPESSSSQSSIVSNRPNAAVGSAAGVVPSSDITHQSNYSDDADIDSDNDEVSDELRKLDEDFQKNLERTRKVFVNRMDNLQRSQVEREAQHQKTLEKHEKERAEFEKRLAQEAEQQNRRIEQLQREWDKRRETVAMNKRRPKDGSGPGAGGIATDVSADALTASASSSAATHLRTASSASSNFSVSPSLSLHKLPQEPGSGGDGGSTDR